MNLQKFLQKCSQNFFFKKSFSDRHILTCFSVPSIVQYAYAYAHAFCAWAMLTPQSSRNKLN